MSRRLNSAGTPSPPPPKKKSSQKKRCQLTYEAILFLIWTASASERYLTSRVNLLLNKRSNQRSIITRQPWNAISSNLRTYIFKIFWRSMLLEGPERFCLLLRSSENILADLSLFHQLLLKLVRTLKDR